MEIVLGNKYQDKTHGITGVAISKIQFLGGYERVCLQSRSHDGKELKDNWFDAPMIVEIAEESESGE